MSYLTRSNIAYDLKISPHDTTIDYGSCKIQYVFSSDLYKRKFIDKAIENRNKINESLSNRFGFHIDTPLISDLQLYTKIEKRGFLIYKDGVKIECHENITLGGPMQIIKR